MAILGVILRIVFSFCIEEDFAATEEQSASMEEIAASSQNLANMAEQLKEIICGFKI
jgi:methyl-accepting chemotaxis protein